MALTTAFASADIEKEVRLGDCPEPVRKTLEANARAPGRSVISGITDLGACVARRTCSGGLV